MALTGSLYFRRWGTTRGWLAKVYVPSDLGCWTIADIVASIHM